MSYLVDKSDMYNKLSNSTKQNSITLDRSTSLLSLTNQSIKLSTKSPMPVKWLSASDIRPKKTPCKTPKKSPSRLNTPNASNLTKTPNNHADRFIPIRSNAQIELGHFKLTQSPEDKFLSPSMKEKQRIYSENLHGTNISSKKILSFNLKPPAPPEGHINPLRSFYSKTPGSSAKSNTRHIPQDADRILDAPDMVDDYYLNLIDWSSNNVLAVALRNALYLWNANDGVTEQLMELPESEIICSVKWLNGNNFLAVGTSIGTVSIWDCQKKKNLRVMDGHTARVPSLSWNEFVLSSGSRSGHINNHDVRKRDHLINRIGAHSQEVCGLSWSSDGRYLASGGNDNIVNIWSRINDTTNHCGSTPVYTLTDHQSAVKALAWCPWQSNLLATGGGTADRMIRIWNSSTGTQTQSVDARSQVCSLLWSTNYRELVSGHGFSACQITIWKYPSMSVVTELNGHSSRILNLALSPDGTTVVSAGADETLRLWKCFQVDQSKKKDKTVAAKSAFESIKNCIR